MYPPIACTYCQSLLSPSQIATSEVACKRCQQAYLLGALSPKDRQKPSIPLPKGIQIHRRHGFLKLILPWKSNLLLPQNTKIRPWLKWLSFPTLPHYFNRLSITLDAQNLSLCHAPLPNAFAYGKKQYLLQEIQQLYIRKTKVKESTAMPDHQRSFALCAVLKNRKNVVLVNYLRSAEEALFLNQEVERFLERKSS